MKLVIRVMLVAAFAVIGITTSQIASAAPADDTSSRLFSAVVPPAAPVLAPNAQGCSGTPTIQYAYANPAITYPGQVTTLQWGLVGNANAAYLQYPNNQRVGIGTPGSQQVNPTQTTTYYIIGVCGGNQVQFPITVTVQNSPGCSGAPQITSFTANPTTINNGQVTTISWGLVANADNVQLSSSTQGASGVPTPGSVQARPNQTTTYYLTAWCKGNPAQAQVTVTVNNPPPPPPANTNAITGMNLNGGLSGPSGLVMTVNYFWNGQDAPAVLQGTAYNSSGGQVAQSNATRINANQNFYANLNFPINPNRVSRVSVCIIGDSGTELVCRSGNK